MLEGKAAVAVPRGVVFVSVPCWLLSSAFLLLRLLLDFWLADEAISSVATLFPNPIPSLVYFVIAYVVFDRCTC